ncbi:MAG: MBL fold metallo-hydrolase [Candidatus Thermoplasmatota archaeon]|nr:MBL fold metallo-hydrolase [Candidatus Thermoplasmatota archaeon]
MVHISQLILGDTGCVSYIVFCKGKRECAIVDSFEEYEEDIHEEIKRLGFPTVKYIIDTHTHADRNSASSYFASEFGVEGIVKSEMTKYKGKKITTKDGDILKIGNAELKVVYTPGHTYDHNSYLVEDNLLSGDCLFIGDVGRIDLGGDPREKAEMLYNSLRKLEQLPANTKVYPNHVGAVHAIDSEDKFSTISKEMKNNEAMQIKDIKEFYTYMTEGWPPKPDNWEKIIEYNLNG